MTNSIFHLWCDKILLSFQGSKEGGQNFLKMIIKIIFWSRGGRRGKNLKFFDHIIKVCPLNSAPNPISDLRGELTLICISTRNANGKKFLHRKVHEIICSSEVKAIFQTSSHACEFEKFSVRFFPFFEYFRPI